MGSKRWCECDDLRKVIISQFHVGPDSVHGSFHWLRVQQNGIWLSRRTGADMFVANLFAWFHDAKRLNDYVDPDHGRRGADFAASLRGKLFDLDDTAFDALVYACEWHTDEDYTDDITIGTCWDADRLDLERVGIIPSCEFMSTDFGREVAKAGSFYYFLSESEATEPGKSLALAKLLVKPRAWRGR